MKTLRGCITLLLLTLPAWAAPYYNIRDYGAKGDGVAKDTAAVQAAIDVAEKAGGGTVLAPVGKYLCGTIRLKSNVALYLAPGSALLESPDAKDFEPYEPLAFNPPDDVETTFFRSALLLGENVHDFAIYGQGVVDGNRTRRHGPKTIAIKNCQRVSIRGITVRNSPNYSISLLAADYVDIDGVTILNSYADGIDPDSSRYVRIANCFIDSHDDAICPKASFALGYKRATEHVTVTNCVTSTDASHFKLGTEGEGGFKNITFSNSTMFNRPGGVAGGGIALETVDGAALDGIVVSNVVIEGARTPIFLRLGNRARATDPPVPGSLTNVVISNVIARGGAMASSITGLPGYPARNVTLDNINITMQGGEKTGGGLDVPEVANMYPRPRMFGKLPAYGFYVRHVEGLTVRNLQVRSEQGDARPAILFDDVRDLELDGFKAGQASAGQAVVWMNNVARALVRGIRAPAGAAPFLSVTGARSGDILLTGNDMRPAAKAVDLSLEAAKSAVTEKP